MGPRVARGNLPHRTLLEALSRVCFKCQSLDQNTELLETVEGAAAEVQVVCELGANESTGEPVFTAISQGPLDTRSSLNATRAHRWRCSIRRRTDR